VPSGGATLAGLDGEALTAGDAVGLDIGVAEGDGETADADPELGATFPSEEPTAQPMTTAAASPTWNRTELKGTSLIPSTRD
jgi:hypothetical protein